MGFPVTGRKRLIRLTFIRGPNSNQEALQRLGFVWVMHIGGHKCCIASDAAAAGS